MKQPMNLSERRQVFPIDSRPSFERFDVTEGCIFACPDWWSVYDLRYSYHRFYYICSGQAWYVEGDARRELKKGFLYIFPSQWKRYSIVHNPNDPLVVLWCHFEIGPDIVNDVIEFDPTTNAAIAELLGTWRRIVDLPEPGNEMRAIVRLMLYMIERHIPFSYVSDAFRGIERYISDNIGGNINTQELADRFGYERSHFSRKFKSVFGVSPGEYVSTMRMSRASTLLRYGFSIDQVCAEIGYSDKKVFSRAFKHYIGSAPSEYQKKHKMQP